MDKFDLSEALSALGMSRAQLARELDIHPNTVSKWTPETVPGYARAYLGKCEELAIERENSTQFLKKVRFQVVEMLDRAIKQ